MSKKYTVDYFIDKFSKIPDSKWRTNSYNYNGRCCALGHCGYTWEKETNLGKVLERLVQNNLAVSIESINDGKNDGNDYIPFKQKKPKARVLAALKKIKKLQSQNKK
jgi:hypothetical protein